MFYSILSSVASAAKVVAASAACAVVYVADTVVSIARVAVRVVDLYTAVVAMELPSILASGLFGLFYGLLVTFSPIVALQCALILMYIHVVIFTALFLVYITFNSVKYGIVIG